MPRKKKQTPPVEEPKVEPKPDYLEQWFVERIGDEVKAIQGKDINKVSTLYYGIYGPYTTQEQCLLALEKTKKYLDKQTKRAKAIAAAEPEPIPFQKKKPIEEESTEKTIPPSD